jgi:type II secretory pathway pseudopilin PulG
MRVTAPPLPPRRQRGFTLAFVLTVAFVGGLLAAMAAKLWSAQTQVDRERELLWAARQYQRAIVSFTLALPPDGTPRAPRTFAELTDDRRFVPPRRHLRRLYSDPFTGKADWAAIRGDDGGIVGLRSQSASRPRASDGLWPDTRVFGDAKTYADWKFVAVLPRFTLSGPTGLGASDAPPTDPDTLLRAIESASPAEPAVDASAPGRDEGTNSPSPPRDDGANTRSREAAARERAARTPPAPPSPPEVPPGLKELLRELGLDPDAGDSRRQP